MSPETDLTREGSDVLTKRNQADPNVNASIPETIAIVGVVPWQTLEWFLASVDLVKQVGTDEDGRPKWRINYSRRGSLPASKVSQTG